MVERLAWAKNFIVKDSTLVRGDLTEIKCLQDFVERGFEVSLPFSGSSRYDAIVDIDGHLLRIQCKTAAYHPEEGILSIHTSRSTTNTQRTVHYQYSKDEIDYFYTCFLNYSFLIPVEETSTTKILRLTPPLNCQYEAINIAHDYLLDNVLEAIQTNTPIKRFIDNLYISTDIKTGEIKEWGWDEINSQYSKRQFRYIKEVLNHPDRTAYNKRWTIKEFPSL